MEMSAVGYSSRASQSEHLRLLQVLTDRHRNLGQMAVECLELICMSDYHEQAVLAACIASGEGHDSASACSDWVSFVERNVNACRMPSAKIGSDGAQCGP